MICDDLPRYFTKKNLYIPQFRVDFSIGKKPKKNNDGEQLPFAKPRPTFFKIPGPRSALVPDHLDNIKLAKV